MCPGLESSLHAGLEHFRQGRKACLYQVLFPSLTARELPMPHETLRGMSQLPWFLFSLFKVLSRLKLESLRDP